MKNTFSGFILLFLSLSAFGQTQVIGQSTLGIPINAYEVPAQVSDAPDILVLGGLFGDPASEGITMLGYEAYANEGENFLNVTFVPAANPEGESLTFPPEGPAYENDWTSWSLWRWIGTHGPDVVIIMGSDPYGLGEALSSGIMGTGSIPTVVVTDENELRNQIHGDKSVQPSDASNTLQARSERSVEDFAQGLSEIYGQSTPAYLTYIPGMALIGRIRLGQIEEVEAIMAPLAEEGAEAEINSSLQIAGHLIFAELAEATGNRRYLDLARNVADLGFTVNGDMLDVMPFHGEYSDAFFMHTPLLAKVGKLTGDPLYFNMALRHVEYLHELLLRPDGLYNHWPYADAAWGRGNAFVALGLALALSDIPQDHPAHTRILEIYRQHMASLIRYVDTDGMWRNVINEPGSWAELSATTMIATAMQRGVDRGWLQGFYQLVVDSAWDAVLMRTDDDYGFINVCTSTPGQDSLEIYLNREALTGRDDRAGGMMLMFASERLNHQNQ